jgi:ketosteroid isomerase-like protein
MKKIFYLTLVAAIIITACQPKRPAGFTDADKAAIRKVADKGLSMVTGVNKDNASALVKFLYTEDAIIFPPNAAPLKGHEAIIKSLQTYPPMTDYIQKPEEIVVFGDFAYQWETWSVTLPLADQTSFKDAGTIFWIWHKQSDGAWKLWREIWHSDLPVPESASTSKP